jgi:hypothetical protein
LIDEEIKQAFIRMQIEMENNKKKEEDEILKFFDESLNEKEKNKFIEEKKQIIEEDKIKNTLLDLLKDFDDEEVEDNKLNIYKIENLNNNEILNENLNKNEILNENKDFIDKEIFNKNEDNENNEKILINNENNEKILINNEKNNENNEKNNENNENNNEKNEKNNENKIIKEENNLINEEEIENLKNKKKEEKIKEIEELKKQIEKEKSKIEKNKLNKNDNSQEQISLSEKIISNLLEKMEQMTYTRIEFDEKIHRIIYDSVYTVQYMSNCFEQFLKIEINDGPFRFTLATKDLISKIIDGSISHLTQYDVIEKFIELSNLYIFSDDQNQINICGKDQRDSKSHYDSMIEYCKNKDQIKNHKNIENENNEIENENNDNNEEKLINLLDFQIIKDSINIFTNLSNLMYSELYLDSVIFIFLIFKVSKIFTF